jgi:hypothetical protein
MRNSGPWSRLFVLVLRNTHKHTHTNTYFTIVFYGMTEIALKYLWQGSKNGKTGVLLRIRSNNFMDRGSELSWLSAFPHEIEFLYPPITFLSPIYEEEYKFKIGDAIIKVVDVKAQMP